MRPTWLLSGQSAGSVVRRPVLLGTALLGDLEMLARYFLVADAVMLVKRDIILFILIIIFLLYNRLGLVLINRNTHF